MDDDQEEGQKDLADWPPQGCKNYSTPTPSSDAICSSALSIKR